MSTTAQLRAVVVGLIAFAAAEEGTLLASAASDVADPGDERRWAAVPTMAHNTEFKAQQAARHPWLNGRPLWLQIVVRGFWHPAGHVADYYLGRSRPGRAVRLQQHMLATTRYLDAPNQVAGMAAYSLACAQAVAGSTEDAARTLADAIALNPDVRANADRDPDLESLRGSGQLTAILAG
jgi:hypothetical protein